jgi:transposase
VELSPEQQEQLQSFARSRSQAHRVVLRAQMVLLAAAGWQDLAIGQKLGKDRLTVGRWRKRYLAHGLAGLLRDAPRPGRPPQIDAAQIQQIVTKTTQEKPPQATHWSTRTMAAAVGVSPATVRRIWKRHGLKPHRVKRFKLSKDPRFAEKLEDIVGLYINPPAHAVVLSADEKSQIQALDRTQKSLPLKKGRCGTMTHDYKRHGTTTLFAALRVLDGTVISTCQDRHRHQEWIKFLELIDAQTPPEQDLHLILDNSSSHKARRVRAWLRQHPRFHLHFTPTSSSWLNMVERFFRDLTQRRLRRGVFRSIDELVLAIEDYIAGHNRQPKPFIWTAKACDILEKVKRARAALDKMRSV